MDPNKFGYYVPQDDENYIAWCEENNLDPWESGTEEEWQDVLEDMYTNPHG